MNENKKSLLEQLSEKIGKEHDNYIKSLYRMDADDIIKYSHKTVMLNEFVCVFDNEIDDTLEDFELQALINVENLLELLYKEWMRSGNDQYDIYKEFVFDHLFKADEE